MLLKASNIMLCLPLNFSIPVEVYSSVVEQEILNPQYCLEKVTMCGTYENTVSPA
jgi:hypothetical protein